MLSNERNSVGLGTDKIHHLSTEKPHSFTYAIYTSYELSLYMYLMRRVDILLHRIKFWL